MFPCKASAQIVGEMHATWKPWSNSFRSWIITLIARRVALQFGRRVHFVPAAHLPAISTVHIKSPKWRDGLHGLCTWLPWVFCAPTFYPKIGKVAHSGVCGVQLCTKPHKLKKQWKATSQNIAYLEGLNGTPFADGWPKEPTMTEISNVSWRCCGICCFFFLASISTLKVL